MYSIKSERERERASAGGSLEKVKTLERAYVYELCIRIIGIKLVHTQNVVLLVMRRNR